MTGRISEEGGEAFNGTQKHNKDSVKSMASHGKRIRKITERSQVNLKGNVLKSRLEIDQSTAGKKRGPYKPRTTDGGNRMILIIAESVRVINGENYVVLQSGDLLLEKWSCIFEWFRGGKAPQDWLTRFQATAPDKFSAMQRLNEEHTRVF